MFITSQDNAINYLANFIDSEKKLKGRKITEMENGENHYIFRLSKDREPNYIAKLFNGKTENRIDNSTKALLYLEDNDITCAPKHIASVKDILLIETEVGEHPVDKKNISSAQLSTIGKSLAIVHNLSVDSYNTFFDTKKNNRRSVYSMFSKDYKTYSLGRFNAYTRMTHKVDKDIKEGFKLVTSIVEKYKNSKLAFPQGFVHGDLDFRNVRVSGKNVYFIDWELSRIGMPFFELSYIVTVNGLNEVEEKVLLDSYFSQSKSSAAFDLDSFKDIKRFHWFNHVIWAACRTAESEKDVRKYRGILDERLHEFYKLVK